jgi:RinA family phage transcriptional activator
MTELKPAIFKFVEHELYNYKYMRRDLRELREDIASGTIGNTTYDHFSTTERYPEGSGVEDASIRLISNKVATRLLRTIEAIDRAIGSLEEEKARMFDLKYNQKKNWETIASVIGISRATYFRWRSEIVAETAKEMGLIQNIKHETMLRPNSS